MPNQYIIALFQPTDSAWCADVYLPNEAGEKGERIFCGSGYVLASEALAQAANFVTGYRVRAIVASVF